MTFTNQKLYENALKRVIGTVCGIGLKRVVGTVCNVCHVAFKRKKEVRKKANENVKPLQQLWWFYAFYYTTQLRLCPFLPGSLHNTLVISCSSFSPCVDFHDDIFIPGLMGSL